jgi:hypothetical protein
MTAMRRRKRRRGQRGKNKRRLEEAGVGALRLLHLRPLKLQGLRPLRVGLSNN